MPMTYTAEIVTNDLKVRNMDTSGTEKEQRELLAKYIEEEYRDYLHAWEVRTGRPWNEMTRIEAGELAAAHPELMNNPGLRSRLKYGD